MGDLVFTATDYVWAGLAALIAYTIYGGIWRLYLSPIAHFPGPRLAALTHLYEVYYNNWLGGKYIWKIQEMHDKYGPIVRISPTDLHVGDPEFYDILYPSTTSGRRANKSASLTKFFGLDDSLFSTIDHDTHRMRRAALLPFFSPSYMRKLEPEVRERLDVLLERLGALEDTGETVNANCVFAAFSNDLVQNMAFGQCDHKLETPNFDSTERDAALSGAQSFHILKRAPWLNNLMMALPEHLASHLNPALGSYMRQKRMTQKHVARLASTSKDQWSRKPTQPIFRALLDSPKLPAEERTVERVAQDAQMLLMAGTLTTASTLEHLIYWMVANPEVLQKLKEELRSVMPSVDDAGKVPLTTLEGLPYLTAVIKESVRLIYGNSTPHFRYCPDQSIVYEERSTGKKWVIPPNTSVGMTSVLLHHNESNFPNSNKFDPERWLGENGRRLERYNVGFGKGSRLCLGQSHAYGIMRLVLSQLWRLWASPGARIGDEIGVLSLHNTSSHDVTMNGDFFIAAYNKSEGVEFKLHSMQ
ncbi:cytochrome P450 [Aspergillus recurvatus]